MEKLSLKQLQNIVGGNKWTNAYTAALGCAGTAASIGGKIAGPWGIAIGGLGGAAVCGWVGYSRS